MPALNVPFTDEELAAAWTFLGINDVHLASGFDVDRAERRAGST
jgi:hypothetical protein